MSVQVSYKKQTFLGIIGLLILFLVVEAIANVWWFTQVSCEFEENEIFMNMDEEKRRQLCVDLYDVKTSGDELIPNQQNNSVNINSLGFRGEEFSPEKPDRRQYPCLQREHPTWQFLHREQDDRICFCYSFTSQQIGRKHCVSES